MSSASLVFRFIGIDEVSPASKSVAAGMEKSSASMKASSASAKASSAGANMAALAVVASAAIIAEQSLKAATAWEASMVRIQTGAGELHQNLAADSTALLKDMGQFGVSADKIQQAIYYINSASYHGKDGLAVLETAMKGAQVGAADLMWTSRALTGIMNAYHLKTNESAGAMNMLIATEQRGKTTLEELAKALPTVTTTAALTGIQLKELGGAMATMTHLGINADVSATYLRMAISNLTGGTDKARKSLSQVGLDATKLSQTLGKQGLAAALEYLQAGIQRSIGSDGLVKWSNSAKLATQTGADFQKVVDGATGGERTLMDQLARSTGGVRSLQAILALIGPNLATFKENTKEIGDQMARSGTEIEGWKERTETLDFKLQRIKGTFEALKITMGERLTPAAKSLADKFNALGQWLIDHPDSIVKMTQAFMSLASAMTLVKGAQNGLNLVKSLFTNPEVAVVLLLAGAFYELYTNSDKVRNSVDRVKKEYGPEFVAVFGQAKTAVGNFYSTMIDGWATVVQKVKSGATEIKNAITSLPSTWQNMKQGASNLVDNTRAAANKVMAHPHAAGSKAGGVLGDIAGSIPSVNLDFMKNINLFDIGRTLGLKLVDAIADGLHKYAKAEKIAGELLDKIGAGFNKSLKVIEGWPDFVKAFLEHATDKVMKDGPKWAGDTLRFIIDGIEKAIKNLPGVWVKVSSAWFEVVKGALAFAARLGGWLLGEVMVLVTDIPTFVINCVKDGAELYLKAGKWLWSHIIDGIVKYVPESLVFLFELPGKIIAWAVNNDWGKTGEAIMGGIGKAISAAVGKIADIGGAIGHALLDGMMKALDSHSPSRKTEQIGGWAVDGFVNLIASRRGDARRAGADLAAAFTGGASIMEIKAPRVAGYDRNNPGGISLSVTHRLELSGQRETVAFVRSLIKDYGAGDPSRAIGAPRVAAR